MAHRRLLVIGNGMASLRLLEEMTALGPPERYAITVVGEEPLPAYNRVLLSPLLAGEIGAGDVAMKTRDWYGANGIELLTGVTVEALDTAQRTAQLSDGRTASYDICVFATGSEAFRLPIAGASLAGVEVFRTLSDIQRLSSAAASGARVAVIGGGLLGIEAAYGLRRAGADVTLVHVMDRLMERQLDADAAALLDSALQAKGIKVRLNAETVRIDGTDRVEALILKNGRRLAADLVVMAVGVKPRTALAGQSGIACRRGIVVNDALATNCAGIFAIGECAEHRGSVYGLVEPAYEQARVLARNLCGEGGASYGGTVLATNLKVSGVPVFSAGDIAGAGAEDIIWRDDHAGSYRRFIVHEGRLAGAVLVGDTTDALWYRDLIRTGEPVARFRPALAFGRAYAEAA